MDVSETLLVRTTGSKRVAAEFTDAGTCGDPRKLARHGMCSPRDEKTIPSKRGQSDRSANFMFTAEAVAMLAPDYVASETKGIKAATPGMEGEFVSREFRRQEPEEAMLVAEVQRIRSAGVSDDYRRVLDLHPGECWDLPTIQSRYRNLMRLLHPDKRGIAGEARAGGRECCDEAITILQRAVDQAKQEVGKDLDPRLRAQQDMRRMQEIQRTRARQAMQRHQQSQVSSLAADIDRALAACPHCGIVNCSKTECLATTRTQPDPTSQKIMEAVAQLSPKTHGTAGSVSASTTPQLSSTTLEKALHEALRRVSSL